jgi:hypothetical protein
MHSIIARIFVFMSFACLLIATPVKEAGAQGSNWVWHGGDAYADLDLPGNDYRNFTVRTGGIKVCKEACAEDSRCQAFTYLGEKHWSSQQGQCYLKTKFDKMVYNTRCASTYKEYPTDFSSANNERIPDKCPEFSFATKSPIPSAVIGGHYEYQISISGGINPITFCPMEQKPDGTPPRCDNSPDQVFSMPFGLKLSKTGLISGQVTCGPDPDPSKCKEQYTPILIQATDNCTKSPQRIQGEFWIQIRKTPLPRGN